MEAAAEPAPDLGRLTDAEALMWRAEADPWFSSAVGVVAALDQPADHDALRRRLAAGIASHPLLSARVVDGGVLAPPRWAPDADFDLDHHVRHLTIPGKAGEAALLDLACRLVADPLDRTRPLWRMWTVTAAKGGRGALVWKLHHALTDGQGALGLAELFVDLERSPTGTPSLDPAELRRRPPGAEGADAGADRDAALRLARRVGAWQLEAARRLAGDALLVGADPGRLRERGADAVAELQRVGRQLGIHGGAGSAAWSGRSRQRRLTSLHIPIDRFRATARALGGTVNDLFVTMVAHGIAELHREQGHDLDHLAVSFIVSTRASGNGSGRNAFVPVRVEVPVGGLDLPGRFAATRGALAEQRSGARDDGLVGVLTSVAAALPTPVVTRAVRSQAAALDVATSCLRGPEFPLFVAGAQVTRVVPVGPVAGTPANITALTYDTDLAIGIHADPVAVGDPGLLTSALEAAYCELERAG